MTKPWEKNQGYEGTPETSKAYDQFLAFLELGPNRTASELATRLGITRQATAQTAKKYNWRERARAYDLWRKVNDHFYDNDSPPPPPPEAEPFDPGPEPEPIEPEVIELRITQKDKRDQINEMIEYRDAFRARGKQMLEDADSMRQLAKVAHADLSFLWGKRMQALQREDWATAILFCGQIKEIVPCYSRLREEVRCYVKDARVHWGDSAALHELISEAFGGKT